MNLNIQQVLDVHMLAAELVADKTQFCRGHDFHKVIEHLGYDWDYRVSLLTL